MVHRPISDGSQVMREEEELEWAVAEALEANAVGDRGEALVHLFSPFLPGKRIMKEICLRFRYVSFGSR